MLLNLTKPRLPSLHCCNPNVPPLGHFLRPAQIRLHQLDAVSYQAQESH